MTLRGAGQTSICLKNSTDLDTSPCVDMCARVVWVLGKG